MSTVRIASLYPIALSAQRSLYSGNFNIPAVQKGGKPEIYTIRDHNQFEDIPLSTMNGGRVRKQRIIVTAMEIAEDIVKQWTLDVSGASPACRPGVWIVRDRIFLFQQNDRGESTEIPQKDGDGKPMYREATEAEQKAMWDEDLAANSEAQANWGNQCAQSGNAMAEDPKKVPFIPAYFKAMATHYGLSPKWVNRATDSNVKNCQWCSETVPAIATVCPKCSRVVDFARYAELEAQQQAAMARVSKGVVQPPVSNKQQPAA